MESTNLMQASHQWATRPADERFTSLTDLQAHFHNVREHSRATVCPSRRIQVEPTEDNKGLVITGPNGHAYAPTNWSFGQLAQLAEAPAGYMRTLPSPIAADCLNYGLQYKRDIEDVGVLLYKNGGDPVLRAATGPRYGRIWNADITDGLVERFGDGRTGAFRIPGEFGKQVEITKSNTTLYGSDRDMFVFLCDGSPHRTAESPRRQGRHAGPWVLRLELRSRCRDVRPGDLPVRLHCCNRIVGRDAIQRGHAAPHRQRARQYIEQMARRSKRIERSASPSSL